MPKQIKNQQQKNGLKIASNDPKSRQVYKQRPQDKKGQIKKHKATVARNQLDAKNRTYCSANLEIIENEISKIPKGLQQIMKENLFEALLYPMTKEEFYHKYYNKKSFVIRNHGNNTRFEDMIEQYLYSLSLRKMMKNTSSTAIHIWKKDKKKKNDQSIKSKSEQDYMKAYDAYIKDGASLYFGAPILFRDVFMKNLNYQMGQNFAGYYKVGGESSIDSMDQFGEIETFVSRQGNYTDWHTDFQENFTLQLKGSKKWKLLRSGLEAPLLGFTPHYKDSGNLEIQQKVHMAYNNIDMSKQYIDRTKMEADCDTVILNEGDILYHPAGIWHCVYSETDSIAVNLSMHGMRMGEFISQAIQGCLYQNLNQRNIIKFDDDLDFKQKLKYSFKQAEQICKDLQNNIDQMVSEGLKVPRIIHFDLDKKPNDQQGLAQSYKCSFDKSTRLYLNQRHLFQILKTNELPQMPSDLQEQIPASQMKSLKYIVHSHFTNQNSSFVDFSSQTRTFLYTDDLKREEIINYLINQKPTETILYSQLKKQFKNTNKKELNLTLLWLIYHGIIVKQQ